MKAVLLITLTYLCLLSGLAQAQNYYEDSAEQGPPQVTAWDDKMGNSGIEVQHPGGPTDLYYHYQNGDVSKTSVSNIDLKGESQRVDTQFDFSNYTRHQDVYRRDEKGNLEWQSSEGIYVDQNGKRTQETKTCISGLKDRFGKCVRQKKVSEIDLRKQIQEQYNMYQQLNGKAASDPFSLQRAPAQADED